MKQIVMVLATVMLLGLSASGEDIFLFSSGELWGSSGKQESGDGWRITRGSKSGTLEFSRALPGAQEWSIVNIFGNKMTANDWSKAQYLHISVANHSAKPFNLGFKFNSDKGDLAIGKNLPPGSISTLEFDLGELGKSINLHNIVSLQIYLVLPPEDLKFEFFKIELSQKPLGTVSDETQIPAKLDMLDVIRKTPAILNPVEVTWKSEPDGKSILLTFPEHKQGMNTWAGLYAMTNVVGTAYGPNWFGKNRMVLELENVTPPGNDYSPLSLNIQSANGSRVYIPLDPVRRGRVTRYERRFDNYGLDPAKITSASLNLGSPSGEFRFRISRWDLEFAPQELAAEPLAALEQMDSDEAKATAASLRAALTSAKGAAARWGDIRNFYDQLDRADRTRNLLCRTAAITTAAREMAADAPCIVGLADSMESIMLRDFRIRLRPANIATLELAANESESFQVVVAPRNGNVPDVRVAVSAFRDAKGNVASLTAKVGALVHVQTKRPNYPVAYVGYRPDGIDYSVDTMNLASGDTVPYWVRVSAPADIAPGNYSAEITVSAAGKPIHSFPLAVEVFGFSIPSKQPLPIAVCFNPAAINSAYGGTITACPGGFKLDRIGEQRMEEFNRLASSYWLNPDYIYLRPEQQNSEEAFDYGMRFNAELKKRGLADPFCILNASCTVPHARDVADPKVAGHLAMTMRNLKFLMAQAERLGLRDEAYVYGFDEGVIDGLFAAYFKAVKQAFPNLKTMTTASIYNVDNPDIENLDIWVPVAARYADDPETVQALRKRGKSVWWYVCNFPRPPDVTLMLDADAIEPRMLMGAMTMHYRPEGFLYWAVGAVHDGNTAPAKGMPRSDWNPATFGTDNGEGQLFMLGERGPIPTQRVENFRDGLEDYHYSLLLESLVKQRQAEGASEAELAPARTALAMPAKLVRSSSDFSRNPDDVRTLRRTLAREIVNLQNRK